MIQANFASGVDELRATEDVVRLVDRLAVGCDVTPVHADCPDHRVWAGVRGDRGATCPST